VASVASPALLLIIAAWSHRWTTDDAFIDFHVVDNLLTGNGPVFNISERVEVYTSPLWIALLATFEGIGRAFVPGRPSLEWCSVVLGLTSGALALVAASLGAREVWRGRDQHDVSLAPLGSLLVIALVPFWDFTTSGLEGGLVLFWISSAFWAVTRISDVSSRHKVLAVAMWLGVGPLVRPDLGSFSVVLLAVVLLLIPARQRAYALIAATAVPLAYEVFRMGYFGAVVPNSAIAKEALLPNWSRGWAYLRNFVGPYQLWFPLVIVMFLEGGLLATYLRRGARRETLILSAPIIGGLLHGLFIVRFGGDFLHARLLLPSFFALCLPVFVVPLRVFIRYGPLLCAWAVICASLFRLDYKGENDGIESGRENYLAAAGMAHPVGLQDHADGGWPTDAKWLRDKADAWALISQPTHKVGAYSPGGGESRDFVLFEPWVNATVVARRVAVGMVSFGGGQHVHICDEYGITDPLGARLRLDHREKSGHEKVPAEGWCLGRILRADSVVYPRVREQVADARAAWRCGDLARIQAAVTEPLSWSRFWRNIWLAPRLTRVRFPDEPARARAELCRD
jgi:arabinofuranosyltransferase